MDSQETQQVRSTDPGAAQRFGVREGAESERSIAADVRAVLDEARAALVREAEPAPEVRPPAMWRQAVAEMVGTGALCFVGILVLVAGGPALFSNGTKDLVAVALAHGLTIAVMVSATMHVSGGQLNPVVTSALVLARKIPFGQAVCNIVAQVCGATIGALVAKVAVGGSIVAGIPALGSGVTTGQGIVTEAALTFLLVFVVFGTAVDPRFGGRLGGLAIGCTVALDILAGGPITGAAMNTARWLGPAIAAGTFPNPVTYLVGPLVGALAAAAVWSVVLLDRRDD